MNWHRISQLRDNLNYRHGYRYIDPLDAWQWVDQEIYVVRLIQSKRHPQGYCLSVWDVTWNGEKTRVQLKRSSRGYKYITHELLSQSASERWNRRSTIVDVVRSLVRRAQYEIPYDIAHLAIAEQVLLGYVLFNHLQGAPLTQSIYGGGHGNGEISVR